MMLSTGQWWLLRVPSSAFLSAILHRRGHFQKRKSGPEIPQDRKKPDLHRGLRVLQTLHHHGCAFFSILRPIANQAYSIVFSKGFRCFRPRCDYIVKPQRGLEKATGVSQIFMKCVPISFSWHSISKTSTFFPSIPCHHKSILGKMKGYFNGTVKLHDV